MGHGALNVARLLSGASKLFYVHAEDVSMVEYLQRIEERISLPGLDSMSACLKVRRFFLIGIASASTAFFMQSSPWPQLPLYRHLFLKIPVRDMRYIRTDTASQRKPHPPSERVAFFGRL